MEALQGGAGFASAARSMDMSAGCAIGGYLMEQIASQIRPPWVELLAIAVTSALIHELEP
jgi:hypothetical protein